MQASGHRSGRIGASCLAVVGLFGLACSGPALPPAGPKHQVVASEQAATDCPKLRAEAQTAREALLGSEGHSLRTHAAQKVWAHAGCEMQVFQALPAPTGTQDQILLELRQAREQMNNALNLLAEVERYQVGRLSVQAQIQKGAAKMHLASLLAQVAVPPELDDKSHLAFASELAEVVGTLRSQAQLDLEACLDAVAALEDRELLQVACAHLATLQTALPAACQSTL